MSVDQASPNHRQDHVSITFDAILTTACGQRAEAVLKNVTDTGFRVACTHELLEGELIQLKVGKQPEIAAVIKWVLGDEAGGIFLNRINISST